MQEGLSEYIERQLRAHSGLSSADYEVLAHLSEAPEGRMRSFALARALPWEKGRLSQHRVLIERAAPLHVADIRTVLIDDATPHSSAC